ncbi:BMP family ABC transporter substrate-binding protein [Lipingzhangella sp. LS1_29]|uniref:BMP family ABC transporter substrate-binding protein n=1 Tax=Lipingzhangella rawalii TaxID=2055835 RepID=A0ABU2H6S1_9ACTN|nr:BMP family ABC transporter substrate-binding protein [Lipingzhangella rawalii]MDS1271004.1 BMP family ABC transporter substrate-binding protein [Lipingzhangella rawalii]
MVKIARKVTACVAAGTLTVAMTACDTGENGDGAGNGDGPDADALNVGLAYDIGGRGDRSFNDAAYAGLELVSEELDLEVNDIEASEGESDAEKVERLELMAEEGMNPVIGVGFAYGPAMLEVAPQYPDVEFAIVDEDMTQVLEQQEEDGAEFPDDPLANVTSLLFAEEEASFLVGAAAAMATETDHVGFIGGVEVPLIGKFEAGYVAGVEHINPDVEVDTDYLTQPPDFDGFNDPARGRSAAEGQYDAGADVIYHAAGASGTGVLEAATDREELFIGVDSDQYLNAPEESQPYVLTSAIKRVDTAVFEFVQDVGDGAVDGGIERFDLANEGVDYSDSNEDLISDYTEELDDLRQQIIDGDIEVPAEP